MSLNIKNEDVHGAVRDLARILGVSQTSAVEIAVRAKLAELDSENVRAKREAEIRRVVAAFQGSLANDDGPDLWQVMEDLHDPVTGLPR
ncbi:type II toxin-antitoxin system VapB family antitoxin [Microbacterium lacus]|uniref:type II toxin-antitoxin system VapB family antitoxin n=1 Tax=Microbacterium lacus TaxID=415217 RepID=UPI00384E4A33